MNYQFTQEDGGVSIYETGTKTYRFYSNNSISLFYDKDVDILNIYSNTGNFTTQVAKADIDTIDGVAASSDDDTLLNQLRECFKIAGGGGGSFDGQLTQGGSDISDANPLPVEIQESENIQRVKVYVTASDGIDLCIEDFDESLNYNSDKTINYRQVVAPSGTYRMTFGWTDGNMITRTKWTKQ